MIGAFIPWSERQTHGCAGYLVAENGCHLWVGARNPKGGGIETIDFIRAKLGRFGFAAYCRGNAIKYLSRLGEKGNAAEDARKAEWYAARLAETLESTSEK